MHRKWLTGLTLVGVAGTGGVAYASVSSPSDSAGATDTVVTAPASTETVPDSTAPATTAPDPSTTAPSSRRDVTYQVGDAGKVEIEVAAATMAAHEIEPADGWTVVATTDTGTHIEVQFTNGVRIVGFSADLVGGEVVVSVTNALVPGSPTTVTTEPVPVTVIDDSTTVPPPAAPATPAPDSTDVPSTDAPPASATTAPSGTGDEDHDDDDAFEDDDDHGDEVDDHDDEDHGDDHGDEAEDHSDEDHGDDGEHHDGVEIGDDD